MTNLPRNIAMQSQSKPPFTIKGLDHVVLRVRSVPDSLKFYCDVLGCHVEREIDSIGLIQLRAGAALIDLVDVEGELGRQGAAPAALDPAQGGRNMDHFAIAIDQVDEAQLLTYLSRHGIAVAPMVERYGAQGMGPSLYIVDPDGNTVELKGTGTVSRNGRRN